MSDDIFKKNWLGCEKDIHLWDQIYEVQSTLEIKLPMPCKIICRACGKKSNGLYYPGLGDIFLGKLVEKKDILKEGGLL